jgi:hypothetical protein
VAWPLRYTHSPGPALLLRARKAQNFQEPIPESVPRNLKSDIFRVSSATEKGVLQPSAPPTALGWQNALDTWGQTVWQSGCLAGAGRGADTSVESRNASNIIGRAWGLSWRPTFEAGVTIRMAIGMCGLGTGSMPDAAEDMPTVSLSFRRPLALRLCLGAGRSGWP